ncbi:hypothetical protein NMY22_g19952 [Coprinellus aureogranulatus]|nr:hypothetical protein NMY22_g19952 [Coprinellus aureogranulatus]
MHRWASSFQRRQRRPQLAMSWAPGIGGQLQAHALAMRRRRLKRGISNQTANYLTPYVSSTPDPSTHLQQGSAFKELVMIPTFAPELARPYHVPGTPEYYAAQAQRLQEAGLSPDGSPLVPSAPAQSTRSPAAASSTSSSPGPNDVQADPQLAGSPEIPLFSARVTMHWTVSVRDGRKVKTAKKKETKLSDPAALLDATRSDLLTTILVAHDIPVGSVVVNAPSGPSFLFWYKGVAKGSASKIVTDAEWLRQREQLKSAWIARQLGQL